MNSVVQKTVPAGAGMTGTATASASMSSVTIPGGNQVAQRRANSTVSSKDVDSAVYAYLQAMRRLKRTKVPDMEIAHALHLSLDMVRDSLARLGSKGVKLTA